MGTTKNKGVGQGVGGGRPLAFKSVKELQDKIEDYFEMCEKKDKPFTMSGLAYALDVSRYTLLNYGKKDKFFNTIQKARHRCMVYSEEQLYRTQGSVNGIKFAMINNFKGWDDKQTTNHTGETPKFNVTFAHPSESDND